MDINDTLDRLSKSYLTASEKQTLSDWLKNNAPTLAGIAVVEVKKLLIAANSKDTSMKYYKQLVEKMNWEERVQLLKLSTEEMRKSTSPNLNLAAIFVSATEIASKLLPILIAII